jgi:uncharacterized MAPEG superfamily protein
MTIPTWVLLGFAGWTALLLLPTVGLYRWSRILTGRAEVKDFRADAVEGTDFYKRSMRAHANCVENLPVYGAIVVASLAANVDSPTLDMLALVLIGARVIHTIVHVAFEQTNVVASLRFMFYFIQFVCMAWMGGYVAWAAAHAS